MIKNDEILNKQHFIVKKSLDFRSARRFHANSWLNYYEKCAELDLEPLPNPLQHTGIKTMMDHYVDKKPRKSLLEQR